MEIEGTSSIVTGGASGLGEATVRTLIEAGSRVAIVDLNKEKGEALSDELGDNAAFFSMNVSKNEEVESVVGKIKETFGTIHIVINCAGIGGSVKIVGKDGVVPVEWFTNIVNVNLVGTFLMIRATAQTMMENSPNENGERGVIINTGSIAAYDGQVGQAAYSASKGGIVSMTLTLAREFANNGIRVMTILPGIFNTPLLANNPPKILERLSSQVPFPARLGEAVEYAALARHIIVNPYLNGEVIRLDGAMRMGFGRK